MYRNLETAFLTKIGKKFFVFFIISHVPIIQKELDGLLHLPLLATEVFNIFSFIA